MKKIKSMMIVFMAILTAACFTACSDDDDNDDIKNNYIVYQNAVNQTVKSQKKNSKVILVMKIPVTRKWSLHHTN